jgi:hypothetical protein
MINLTNLVIALLVSLWFFRRAKGVGKDPNRWALVGWAVYFVPASLLTGILLGVWQRSLVQAVIPLEAHFFVTESLSYQLFGILLPSVVVGLIVALHVYCACLAGETARRMNRKTYVFEGVALVLVAVGWLARPGLFGGRAPQDYVGSPVFADFTSPRDAASLEIVAPAFDTFRVAQDAKGIWRIPSHSDYLADASEHMGRAASGLINLKILRVVSESPEHHALYGVLEPTRESKGTEGVGTKVTITDRNKKAYSLIIGKEVAERPGQRYVRVADQDAVFVVDLAADTFSANFGDWIEKNLLNISTSEIKSVAMADYTFDIKQEKVVRGGQLYVRLRPDVVRRGLFRVEPDDSAKPDEPRWKLAENKVDQKGSWTDAAVAPDEELNASKLDDMKYAFSDLKIVDVARKHPGLAGYLRVRGKFPLEAADADDVVSPYGFHMDDVDRDNVKKLSSLFPVKEGDPVLLSTQGDVRIAMKGGMVYVLRFGQITSSGKSAAQKKKEPAKKEAEKKSPEKKDPAKDGEKKDDETAKTEGPGLNRYLFVMAEFDPSLVPAPQYEKLPELPKPGETPKSEPAKTEPSKTDAGKTPETPKPDAAKKEEPAKKPDPEAERKRIEEERKRIEAANAEKKKQYDKEIEDGQKKVKELNDRFADWFYVISDNEYKRIHLARTDIVKKKEKKEEPKKEEAPEAKKEPPAAPKTEPAAAPKKEEAKTAPKSEPSPPAPKKEEPAPAPKKVEPPPAPKKVEPAKK